MSLLQLTDHQTLQHLLTTAGVRPTRSSGQNFLVCNEPIEAVVLALRGGPEYVTELGAGVGPLTQALIGAGLTVRAIERDSKLVGIMHKAIPVSQQKRLTVIEDDLRRVAWEWDKPYQLVGNIPYNLSGLILRRITRLEPAPQHVVLMVQKEVAERILTEPPQMSLVGLAVQLWGTPKLLLNVPADCFWPAPKVSSALISITPHNQGSSTPQKNREAVLSLARRLFQTKRKQIGGTLARLYKLDPSQLEKILAMCNIMPPQRPQELTLQQWQNLEQELSDQRRTGS